MKYDFIAIGDVVTDAFIRLFDSSAEVTDGEHPKLSLRYGEKIPFEEAHIIAGVGNSANAAVAASRLGLNTALISNVGSDEQGSEMLAQLKKEKVDTDFITINQGKRSNYHYVLWYKDDRTILIKQEEYAYHVPKEAQANWLYFSSVGEHAVEFHDELAAYMEKQPDVNLVFQPGTFQIRLGADRLHNIYKHTRIFFCNREEAELVLHTDNNDIKFLADGIRSLGPKIVVITDGKKGAYTLADGELWFMPPYPDPKPPYERTGAGDAFSSTFSIALALGLSVHDAMMWGPINSMSVVQYVGAQAGLLSRNALEQYLKGAPQDYKPQLLGKL